MQRHSVHLLWVPAALAAAAMVVLVTRSVSPQRPVVVGMVEGAQIEVAAKIPGRLDSVFVREGDRVVKGQVLATLESREVNAKVEQARGAMAAAAARRDMARHGARKEEREAVEKLYNQACHQYELAEKTYRRIQAVFADSVVSAQERDQMEFKFRVATEERDAAHARYQMVLSGARDEEIQAAEGLCHQARSAWEEAGVYQQETRMTSRADGEITKRAADPGEIVTAGYPVFTVFDPTDVWVVLQLREDQMVGVQVGSGFLGTLPALGRTLRLTVDTVAPMADFATWRATNQKGDFDLKTFEVKLRPIDVVEGLRPGMSVQVAL